MSGAVERAEVRAAGRDLAAAVLRQLAGIAVGLALVPLVGRGLGPEALAGWALLGTASFVLGIADLGTTTVVQRETLARPPGQLGAVVGETLGIILLSTPPLVLLAGLVLRELRGASPTLAADFAAARLPALGAGGVAALTLPVRGVVLARGGVGAIARARAAGAGTQLLGSLVILRVPSLVVPALALLAGCLVELALVVVAARALEPGLALRPVVPAASRARAHLVTGAAALVINVAVLASIRLDAVILAHVASLSAVAAYGVAARAVDQSYTLAKQVSTALLSRLGDARARSRTVRLGTGVLGSLTIGGMLGLALHGGPLLEAWAGDAAEGGAPILAVLGVAAVLSSVTEMPASAVALTGKSAWRAAVPFLGGALVNVVVSLALARPLGGVGIALGTVAGGTLTLTWIVREAARELGWSALDLGRLVAPLVASALGAALVASLVPFDTEALPSEVLPTSLLAAAAIAVGGVVGGGLAVFALETRALVAASVR